MEITIVIPTYNRYTLLKRAITSLYNQSCQPKEIIVVDDGSTDNTKQIQNDFPEIIYIYQENRGVSAARNRGVKNASCEWIAFLDSDDEFHPGKLQKQLEFHQENPDILMSYTAEKWVRNGKEVKVPKKYQKIGKDIFAENVEYCNIAPSSVMLHKKVFQSVGMFDETLWACEDYEFWLRILMHFEAGLINEKLIIKHAGHENQLGFSKGLETLRIKALETLITRCKDVAKQQLLQQTLEKKQKKQYNSKIEHSYKD